MVPGRFRFDRFVLDPGNRQLRRDDAPVELNARYLDALALLVREAGGLVTKDRFLADVWRGVPVTDEALTQCIRTLRRTLGDDAANPRFIETIPKHGYRFIGAVEAADRQPGVVAGAEAMPAASPSYDVRQFLLLGAAGTIGAGVAGLIGGLFYGFAGAAQPLGGEVGAASTVLVLLWLTMMAALTGGAGVSFGIAVAGFAPGRYWSVAGGAAGGLIVGGLVKLLGLDAFNLLLGRSPGNITGALEGALLGGAIGLGAALGGRGAGTSWLRRAVTAGIAGGVAGVLIPLLGGRLMGGSLVLLARSFPDSRLQLDRIGSLVGEDDFGPVSQIVTGALEGMLFAACIVGAMALGWRRLSGARAR